jgi:hypothetical protein
MKKLFYYILFFSLLTSAAGRLVFSQINYNKVYYFYYSIQENSSKTMKFVWVYNDTVNECHEFTSYAGKENKDLLHNATYLGSGFIDEVIIKDGVFYFKCSRFREYCDFKKLKVKITP